MDTADIIMNAPDSDGSGSGDEYSSPPAFMVRPTSDLSDLEGQPTPIATSPPSLVSTLSSGYASTWSSRSTGRPRGSSLVGTPAFEPQGLSEVPVTERDLRLQRPSGPARTPSSTYAPQRRPPHFINLQNDGRRSSSTKRNARRDPNAQYRAQEKAYVQRLRANPQAWYQQFGDFQGMATIDSDIDEPSPSSEMPFEDDQYDPDIQLFLAENDNQPTIEELKNPKNQERLEWHAMLASVLKGDVVKQEKQRLIGSTETRRSAALNGDIWLGVRAKACGRSVLLQKKLIEDARASLATVIEDIINFQIKGEKEIGKPATEQVEDVVRKIGKCQDLYPTRKEMELANPRAASEQFHESCAAVCAWHNITQLINTELAILQNWVGNDELDFTKPRDRSTRTDLSDDGSFLDRIMKEDGLKTLQGKHNMIIGIGEVINKAKATLIENAEAFSKRHLPPYIEELLTLINFPSRLIQEIIRVRLSYAKKMRDPAQQSPILVDQMISQFQILMRVAVEIKRRYLVISKVEPGWDLPPCIDENFDNVVVDAMKYYFRLLNWKLNANKNTFKEAEILEQEWGFSNEIGRQLQSGDIEVAEHALTAKSLQRLMIHFERELSPRPDEDPADMDKRYKSSLDSTRVRQRKLYRFSRFLRQLFENATEYNLGGDIADDFFEALLISDHFLITSNDSVGQKGVYLIAHHALWNQPVDIQSILGTSFREEDHPKDGSNYPYILVIRPERQLSWIGKVMEVEGLEHPTDVRPGKLRLVADGTQQRLVSARHELAQLTNMNLDIAIEQRANLGRVNAELNKIKKISFKLSMTIMDSVAVIRRQLREKAIENTELIQACYAFATEFGKRSSNYVDANRRAMNSARLVELSLEWVSFICDDCDASDRRTFKWAVAALEFAMAITSSNHLLSMDDAQYSQLRVKVAGCMSVLISHFDIMGARSTLAAQAENKRLDETRGGSRRYGGGGRILSDEEATKLVCEQRLVHIAMVEDMRLEENAKRQTVGKVLEGSNEADRSLTVLSSSATNVSLRWQQGQFIGGGTFGSVYVAINLDSNYLMAVKEIRLQDPQLIPVIAQQIRDEMGVLEVLDHPNIVSYYGIEVHRDKVYIFMEYCSGGSLAGLLEHGRVEDETFIMVYALQLLEGLAYLHQAGIIHRDIKPENILLDHNGVIKYVDFGAAKIIARQGKTVANAEAFTNAVGGGHKEGLGGAKEPQRKNQKTMTGTPMYMSPEVIRGDASELVERQGAIDIWSLGCVILEMATGRRPWSSLDNEWAIMYNIAQGNQPQLPTREQLSDVGIDFLSRCFERDPLKRPTAAELLQHEWIVSIRNQVVVEPQTPISDAGSSSTSNSSVSSRHNSSTYL
ncbi:hypothetical protein ZTR_01703 [Talaromyces verruculosus]|nr:hypothetical protein ZTR_01703 [Talaromyces verruculosus]